MNPQFNGNIPSLGAPPPRERSVFLRPIQIGPTVIADALIVGLNPMGVVIQLIDGEPASNICVPFHNVAYTMQESLYRKLFGKENA